ncbi:MAG: class I SAM-dependent methyltransferase [Proteobacteria bacterium]|nr:class I SAM-dependent methyltransferase [Pseudomonadota bacterium]
MTQNIYDDAGFFAGYSQLRRSVDGLGGAPEWPTLQSMLPALTGKGVVDLGCGFGWFCRWARDAGAASVLGLDVSANMLARARETASDAAIAYRQADLETLDLPAASFDLAYSSLTLHYLEKLAELFATVHRALVPDGRFVFSAEHPLYTEPGPDYLDEGPRTSDWLAKGVVKQHRTLATYLNLLIDAGFTVRRVEEWGPTRAEIAAHPEWKIDHRRPSFLLVSAAR